jgi:predicted nicotinamide N-methyase
MYEENGIVSNLSINSMNTLYYDPLPYEAMGVKIFIPDPLQVKNTYEQDSSQEFPYWSKIWPSSLALAHWLNENAHYLEGKKVFEIGAGLGLPSFIAAKYASSVMMSDFIPLAVEWMNYNIHENGANSMGAILFDWRTRHLPTADMVLLSDVGYREEDLNDVHDLIRQYIASCISVVLTVPARRISTKFVEPLEAFVIYRELIHALDTEVLLLVLGVTDSLSPALKKNC